MSLTVVDSAVATGAVVGTTGLAVTHGFTLQDGDVLYCWTGRGDDAGTAYACTGWTQLTYREASLGDDRSAAWLRKVITNAAGEPSSYTFTNTGDGGNDNQYAIIVQMRDVNSTPEDAATVNGDAGATLNPDQTDITTVTDGAIVLAGMHISSGAGTLTSNVGGAPSGCTLLEYGIGNNGANPDVFGAVAWKAMPTAGGSGIGVWTNTGTGNDTILGTVAVRPAPAADPFVPTAVVY